MNTFISGKNIFLLFSFKNKNKDNNYLSFQKNVIIIIIIKF